MTITTHTKGLPPLDEPIAGLAIERRLQEERDRKSAEHEEARVDPARFAASDSYACERKVAFGRLGVPKDIVYDQAQLMTFKAGDWYHQITQEALVQWLDCRCEVDFDWRPTFSIYGRGDGLYELDRRIGVEIKSQAGFGFDLATGARRSGEGPGPKIDHLIQGGLFCLCPTVAADALHVIYLNKDRGAVAEWVIGVDDPLPHLDGMPTIRALVETELARLAAVADVMDAGDLPARMIPGYGLVEGPPPEAGSRDNPWNCRYCSWQPTCAALSAERVEGWVDAFRAEKEGATA